jgi:energy-coupling factor transport system ATP-binding protein
VPPKSPVALQARNWGWRHGTRKAWAIRGLDLSIEPGERVMLLGPSGAGKSTLLAGLAGLLDPVESGGDEEGELLLDGIPARTARIQAVRAGRARTGLLLQDPQAQTVLARCGDDVAFGLENHAVPFDQIWPRVDQALREVGFPYGRPHPTAALSGGERQRLALAGVLALRPGLLLLDEPTAMLDPAGAELVRQSVAAVLASTGAGCLLVEHRVEPWLGLIDRVVVLEPGAGVRADGSPEQVFAEQSAALAAAGVWVPGVRVGSARAVGSGTFSGELRTLNSPTITAAPINSRDSPSLRPEGPPARLPAPDAALLTAENLAARRPEQPRVAVQDLNFTVQQGRSLCVTGPNGAGKSTLALTLAGLIPPDRGRLIAGPALADGIGPDPYAWRAAQLVSRIGTVFQDPQHQFVAPTVAAELAVGPNRVARLNRRRDVKPGNDRTDQLLDRLRLRHLAQASPFTLSGGEQRRLSVATVLATAPRLLVLDEPTFGQDARTWAELVALLGELQAEGTALVVATHDLDLVDELGATGGEVLEL